MRISQFSQYLSRIAITQSRLEITQLLAELFEDLKVEEIRQAVYLILGKLGAAYENQEFGMADRMVIRSICLAYGQNLDDVSRKFKSLGDLGLVASEFCQENFQYGEWSIVEVYERLRVIARTGGEGSQERKVAGLAELLKTLDPLSVRFITRVPIGKLRMGVGEMTILDGLSWMITGGKQLHAKLEEAYSVGADSGLVAESVLRLKNPNKDMWRSQIEESLAQTKISVGVPVVSALCGRMDTFGEVVTKLGEVACEPKYDGTRVQIHFMRKGEEWQIRTFTRNLEESSGMFPEIQEIGKYLDVDEVVLDSEAVGYDLRSGQMADFQVTMTRKRKHGIKEQTAMVPLRFMLFDVLYARGGKLGDEFGDVHSWSLSSRRELLNKIVKPSEVFQVDPLTVTTDALVIKKLHSEYLNLGLEGVVIKQWQSAYVPGRKKNVWIKMKEMEDQTGKLSDTIDCLVMGYYRGEGRRTALGIGSLLLGVHGTGPVLIDLEKAQLTFEHEDTEMKYLTISKLGTKLTDADLISLEKKLSSFSMPQKPDEYVVAKGLVPDVWVSPHLVMEVAADNITKSPIHSAGVALRFPRLVRERSDKRPDQITTVEEVVKIAKMQKDAF